MTNRSVYPGQFRDRSDNTTGNSSRHLWSEAVRLPADLYPGVGGKRFRAELVQRAYAFGGGKGEVNDAIIDAIETLHAGSLVVDDFEDDSARRRDQPALHRVVGAARAVNAGNWMYFRALEIAGDAYDDPRMQADLLSRFVQTARQCHEGQAVDLSASVVKLSARHVRPTALAISRWKTGRLVALAAWCGAHAASAPAPVLAAVSAYGCRVGVCLQMKNDLDELRDFARGADRCDDLRNRRVTWPWAWAAAVADGRYEALQARLRSIGNDAASLRSVARALASHVDEAAHEDLTKRLRSAECRLKDAEMDCTSTEGLTELAERLLKSARPIHGHRSRGGRP
ncbi:MAG: polyprenyl synthetase family protein [Planctomycetota bacterium]